MEEEEPLMKVIKDSRTLRRQKLHWGVEIFFKTQGLTYTALEYGSKLCSLKQ